MIIKKRFGKRNFVQYLGLQNDDYALVPKKKKKQTVYLPGVDTFYRNSPGSQAEFEAQQMANSVRFIPHKFEDQRAYRYTAKATPPVPTSFDRVTDVDAQRIGDASLRAQQRAEQIKQWKRDRAREEIFRLMKLRGARRYYRNNYFKARGRYYQFLMDQYESMEKAKDEAEKEAREEAKKEAELVDMMAIRNKIKQSGRTIVNAMRDYVKREKKDQDQFEKRLQKALSRSNGVLQFAHDTSGPKQRFNPEPWAVFLQKTPSAKGKPRTSLTPNPAAWSPHTPIDDELSVLRGNQDGTPAQIQLV